ncbi:unnamed protein product [Caenorhabditis angaria]|uniref:Nose resistant-to-fluoxetine protein N-terminal domain-containing protein n=1 Tax=Caenorhabditis angaria TaxID=860376 RepID=A0A9P1ICL1_9PELO|nr:unnamed protein product [Caenorhabditis angaria]
MHFHFLILIFVLLSAVVAVDWKNIKNLKIQNVSTQCAQDVSTWIRSLEQFDLVTFECLALKKCSEKQKQILKDNLYAFQQLDAFGKFPPAGLLEYTTIIDGSSQECERISGIKYETNYCYLALFPNLLQNLSTTIATRSAVCMPKSCGNQDLITLYNQFDAKVFTAKYAFCAKRDIEKDSAFWGFSIFLIVIVSIAILSTIIDYLRETVSGKSSHQDANLYLKVLFAFSFWTNAGTILSVKEQKTGFIKSLDCIRTITMSWVLFGHLGQYFAIPETMVPLESFPDYFFHHLIINAVLSVDTFFLLSGLVLSYMFFKERPKSETMKNPITWIMFYVHRYLRLTPPMMIFIGFFTVYMNYIQGPAAASLFNIQAIQVDSCKKLWWHNLIYINNFGSQNPCYGPSWYLAADTQLYLIAPIFIIALYISSVFGVLLILAGVLGSVVTTYILYSIYDMSADIYITDTNGKFGSLLYQKPWIRCTPYLIGLIAGYIIAIYSKRKPKLNWMLILLGWLIAFAIAFACMFSNFDYDKGAYWSWFAKGTFYNFTRIGWAIALSWLIIANHFGWGGPINNFMAHPIWQPFGRLSYCAYIVHLMVVFYYLNLGERPIHYYSLWQMYVYYAIPATILTFTFAFFWSCLFEMSTLKLEKLLIEGIMRKNEKPKKKRR